MKVAIIGSRNFTNYNLLRKTLIERNMDIEKVVSGGASGADRMGERFADEFNIKKEIYLPDWKKYGKSAGLVRNKNIVDNSDVVFAFWDGESKGTLHSINIAKKALKEVVITKYTK